METVKTFEKNTGPIDSVTLNLLIKRYPSFADFMSHYHLDTMNVKWYDYQRYMDLVKQGIW